MARPKKVKDEEVVNTEDFFKSKWITQYGDIFVRPDQVATKEKKIISVCPTLDISLGGGIVESGTLIISGAPKVGKTTISLQIAKNAANMYGKKTYYFDIEGRFKKLNLSTVQGLDMDKFELIQSSPDNILSSEAWLNIAIDIIKSCKGACIVLDSVSNLCSEKEQLDDLTPQTRNLNPKILASFCRKIGTILPANDILLILIVHVIANTGGNSYNPFTEDSGNSIQFAADTKLRVKSKTKWTDTNNKQIGQMIKIDIGCSSLGPPNDCESYIKFSYGMDECFELCKLSQDLGFVTKKGAWLTLELEDWNYETKFCGDLAFADYLRGNKNAYIELEKLIYESCNIKPPNRQLESKEDAINEPLQVPSTNEV